MTDGFSTKTIFTQAIILDFEATCDNGPQLSPQEIIEFPSVAVSLDSLEVVDEFESFVRPVHHPVLTDFCKNLTSINQADVDRADPFVEVLQEHETWLQQNGLNEKNSIIVTCGDWDLKIMYPAQCAAAEPPVEVFNPIYTRWLNIKHPFCTVLERPRAKGMASMLRSLDLPLMGHHHRGIDDCRNIAELFKALIMRGAVVEVTGELPASRYPAITIQLRLGDRVERVVLQTRSLRALRRLSGEAFQCSISGFHRQDGSLIKGENDLRYLNRDEEVLLSQ